MKLDLQLFGGRGGASSGGGSAYDPENEVWKPYKIITINRGKKIEEEGFYSRLDIEEKKMNFVRNAGKTYKQYMRGDSTVFLAWEQYGMNYQPKTSFKDLYAGVDATQQKMIKSEMRERHDRIQRWKNGEDF